MHQTNNTRLSFNSKSLSLIANTKKIVLLMTGWLLNRTSRMLGRALYDGLLHRKRKSFAPKWKILILQKKWQIGRQLKAGLIQNKTANLKEDSLPIIIHNYNSWGRPLNNANPTGKKTFLNTLYFIEAKVARLRLWRRDSKN